jgi:hypothetical protein
MPDSPTKTVAAPPLSPVGIHDILRDADALLTLMGRESLDVVAELANTLTVSAHDAGALEIEEAASNLRRLASCHGTIALAGAIRALSDSIAKTERSLAA